MSTCSTCSNWESPNKDGFAPCSKLLSDDRLSIDVRSKYSDGYVKYIETRHDFSCINHKEK